MTDEELVCIPRTDLVAMKEFTDFLKQQQMAGMTIRGPLTTVHQPAPTDLAQQAWVERKLGLHLTKALPSLRFLASTNLVASAAEEVHFILQASLIAVVAFLDHRLDTHIQFNGLPCAGSGLYHRIETVAQQVPDAAKLHSWKEQRNDAAHEPHPPSLTWEDVEQAAGDIEDALVALGELHPTPDFSSKPTLEQLRETPSDPEVWGRRTLKLPIEAGGQPYRD